MAHKCNRGGLTNGEDIEITGVVFNMLTWTGILNILGTHSSPSVLALLLIEP